MADKAVLATAARIDAIADDSIGFATAGLEVDAGNGPAKLIRIEAAKGDPRNPMRWDDMWSKFDGLAAPVLGSGTRGFFDLVRGFGQGVEATVLTERLAGLSPTHSASLKSA